MKKTYLAASIAALLAASASTQATQVFKDSKNTVDIGGYADITLQGRNNVNSNVSGDMNIIDNSSRINFVFSRDIGNGWTGGAAVEYAANLVGSKVVTGEGVSAISSVDAGDKGTYRNLLTLRLGNVSLGKDKIGTFTVGKSWGVYYDVGGVTDVPHVWSPVYGIYGANDGGLMGTGRADKVIQYRNQMGGLKIGLQYQPHTLKEQENVLNNGGYPKISGQDVHYLEYGPNFGLSLRYEIGPVELGVAYNTGEIAYGTTTAASQSMETSESLTDSITGVSIKFGDYDTNGAFAGFVYSMGENHSYMSDGAMSGLKGLQPESTAMELVVSFKTDMIRPYLGYYTLETKKSDDVTIVENSKSFESITSTTLTVGADFFVGDGMMVYLEYAMDMGSEADPDVEFISNGMSGADAKTLKYGDAMSDGYGGWALGIHYDF